jgi:glycosyltransferase involved in cell wall biosynthesis
MPHINKTKSFLFIIGFTCPFPGAGWWRIFYFAKYLKSMGYESRILSCFSPLSFNVKKIVKEDDINIYNIIPYIPLNNPFMLCINSFFALITSFLFFVLFRPSSVLISVPPADQLMPVLMLSKIIKCKLIIDYRDEFEEYQIMHAGRWSFFYRLLKRIFPHFYKKATLITTVTPAVAENLNKKGIHNIEVIYDGVDTKIFRPLNRSEIRRELQLPQDSFIIVYLGNIYDPYRVDIVVKALKKLKEKEHRQKYLLLLVGGGNIKSILDLANNLGISDSVKYFGIIKNPIEVVKILNSADCGVIPYDDNPLWQRTYSTKLFEYCAVGLPVIVTVHENSALANIVRTNRVGLVVPPINVDALASSLETLSNDKELRDKMSLSALLFAQAYDREKLVKKLLETIKT